MARTTLFYGESGTYKTSNLGFVADHISALTGGVVRAVTSDSGFGPLKDQIRRGVIQAWLVSSSSLPLGAVALASQGWWPTELNIETGKANEESLRPTHEKEWPFIGGYLVEGLYMIGMLLADYLMSQQRATGEPLQAMFSEELAGQTIRYADSSRGTYKFIQNRTYAYCSQFKALPCHDAVFTSHESKGEDVTRRLRYGPAVLGTAMTDKVSGWFENTFHFDNYTYQNDDGREMVGSRAYFDKHSDLETPNIWWPAKLGVEPEIAAKVRARYPQGYVPLLLDEHGNSVSGLQHVFEILDEREVQHKELRVDETRRGHVRGR